MKSKRTFARIFILFLATLLIGCGNSQTLETSEEYNKDTTSSSIITAEETSLSEHSETETIVEETTASEPEEIVMVEFTNEAKNFSLMIPSNWVIVDQERYGIALRPNRETQTTFYVDTHTTIFSDYSYDDFVGDMIDDVMRIRSKSTFEAQENLTINDYPFVVLPYSETTSSGIVYYYKAFFTAKDIGYEMYYAVSGDEFDLYQPIMEEVAMSFKFIK